ncbi:MAG: hypothetical protein AAB038_04885 [Planctomycetota bacterium]
MEASDNKSKRISNGVNTLYKSIDNAVLKAVANLYSLLIRQDVTASYPVASLAGLPWDSSPVGAKRRGYSRHNKITLSGSRINGAQVPCHVYQAIAERIKYNANLHNKKSGKSRIILTIAGKTKVFKVTLSAKGVLELTKPVNRPT